MWMLGWMILVSMSCWSGGVGGSRGHGHMKRMRGPSSLELYYHDIRYGGNNMKNSTSAMVAAPYGQNLTSLSNINNAFGDMVVFNDRLTEGPELNSTVIGSAQGFYFYDQMDKPNAWFAFTAVLDTPHYNGTLTFMGADRITLKKRDISVVGGTGDFALARGIATLQSDAVEENLTYFRLLFSVKLFY
eukprot:Gb_23182 [translate_table: standard]